MVSCDGIREGSGDSTDEDTMEQNAHLEEHALHKGFRFGFFALGALFVRSDGRFLGLGWSERLVWMPDGAIDEVAAVVVVSAVASMHLGECELDGSDGKDTPHRDCP